MLGDAKMLNEWIANWVSQKESASFYQSQNHILTLTTILQGSLH